MAIGSAAAVVAFLALATAVAVAFLTAPAAAVAFLLAPIMGSAVAFLAGWAAARHARASTRATTQKVLFMVADVCCED
jgi:hypothetical protein